MKLPDIAKEIVTLNYLYSIIIIIHICNQSRRIIYQEIGNYLFSSKVYCKMIISNFYIIIEEHYLQLQFYNYEGIVN